MTSRQPTPTTIRRACLAAAVFALVLGACTQTADTTTTRGAPRPATTRPDCVPGASPIDADLVPECGVWLGTIDPRLDAVAEASRPIGLDHQEDRVSELASGSGDFTFDLIRFYLRPTDDVVGRITEELDEAADGERVAFLSWKVAQGTGAWGDIAAGNHDLVISAVAETIAGSGQSVFLTVHHEPENDPGEGTAEDYVAMWRHVHDLVESTLDATGGGGDVVWVMNYQGHSTEPDRDLVASFYPGEAYVDWIAYNPYNWAGCHDGATWRSFADVVEPLYEILTTDPLFLDARGAPKPLMIGETGTNEGGGPRRKAQWLTEMADTLRDGEYPQLKAVVYFNHAQPVFCDRLWDSSPAAADAFAEMATDPFFNPRGLDEGVPASRSY
jgi:hypothetical protein